MDIQRIIESYFSQLFTAQQPSEETTRKVLSCVCHSLSQRYKDFLALDFNGVEIRKAVFNMHPTKAPGPDGLPTIFFQKYWDSVGPSVTDACLKCLNSGSSLLAVNDTLICLIPKVTRAERMTEFRPISLCNVVYKIVSKALSNRLRTVLSEVISEAQSAFIPDMAKAYDRVEWGFLRAMMEKLGFPDKWINQVMECVATVSFSFLVNGEICGSVKPTRGLRQGDRLSPYLFLLCTEGFSSMLSGSVERGELTGLKCGQTGPVVSHLFFADDSLFFTKATAVECGVIRRIIEDYSKASGQLVNFCKSAVCMSKTISSGEGKRLADIIGVQRVWCHERYLGLPSFGGRNKRALFNYIKDRMWERVKGWRGRLLSIGGKEVLIRSVLQSIPAYTMNLFHLPKGLVTKLHRLCSRFWWGSTETSKKMHWASWRRLCRNKSAGGLGFCDLSMFNQALLAKQGWRLVKYPNSLVARGNGLLECGSRWRVGSGNSIRIYDDRWFPRPVTFKVISPCVQNNIYLVRHLRTVSGGWNNQLVPQLFFKEDAEMILSIPLSNTCRDDSITWHYTVDGEYTVRSGYNLGMCRMVADSNFGGSSNSGLENAESFWKTLWRINVPNKIKLFLWKACNNWLSTRANLAMRGIPADSTCVLCYRSPETTKHALWGCAKLKESIQNEDLALLSVLIWRIWFLRNERIQNIVGLSFKEVVGWAKIYLAQFKEATAMDVVEQRRMAAATVVRWEPPLEYLYKINTDVAIKIAEAMAILCGIVFSKDMGLLPAVVESDALGVVNLINTGSAISADVGVVLNDILNIISTGGIELV
ncbi:hypothetical protein Dsin_019593 [Dipteronia sinensis]|uniref:Reverse transcriptase domain-containing protein n=1 Tax=Dipteronia sinensis TaxID=43782 RepID=A0AAE0A7I6_9ROSI|nr:hypothetical protein Dsin_019593 [Dipteronia sinensis]